VDLGAGTGRFAIAAARRFGRVTAVDISPAMLAYLRSRAAAAGLTNLERVQAGFLSYQHAGRPPTRCTRATPCRQVHDRATALMMTRLHELLDPNLNTVEQKASRGVASCTKMVA
jgi:ubiquinone/menaquinone biosynthesis C-methylase UbiE